MTHKEKRCQYCGKIIKGKPYETTIWINHQRRRMIFCNKQHATYRQMGAEG